MPLNFRGEWPKSEDVAASPTILDHYRVIIKFNVLVHQFLYSCAAAALTARNKLATVKVLALITTMTPYIG